ncbi:MAG: DUF1844 domain-containing protein [Desulfobacterales bacterium]|nr:DUF1844 domain-containing protein [Desulfobacterales bacterium]
MPEDKKDFILKDSKPSAEEAAARKAGAEAYKNMGEAGPQLPRISFSTFIFSLSQSALVHLGLIEEPGAGKKEKNLSLAKQTIDILGVLEEKTKGNLSSDEALMLKNMLADLRISYVKEQG